MRVNDAEFEESDDEDDVQRQRTGLANQKRPRLDEEESAPKPPSASTAAASVAENNEQILEAPKPNSVIPSPLPPAVDAPASPVLEHAGLPASISQGAPSEGTAAVSDAPASM